VKLKIKNVKCKRVNMNQGNTDIGMVTKRVLKKIVIYFIKKAVN